MLNWMEIAADYRCNHRCVGCMAAVEEGPSLSTREIFNLLREGRRRGAWGFWFGGGEPTLRPDLLKVVRAARKLGYRRIKVQTNAMLLASEGNCRRLVEAGVTEVNVALKAHTSELQDRLAAAEGSFAQLEKALAALSAAGVPVEGDVLLYRQNVESLPEIVRHYHARGVRRFNLWHLSLFGADPERARELEASLPTMSQVAAAALRALDLGLGAEPDFLTALHLPPCTLPPRAWRLLFRAADLRLLVADPGGMLFPLERSPFEGGVFLDRCEGCAARSRCDGLRADYLEVHGDEEFQPLPMASSP